MSAAPAGPARGDLPGEALVATPTGGLLFTGDGEWVTLSPADLTSRLKGPPLLVCHARALARRAGLGRLAAYDLLELFAFVHPARFCRPTALGLCQALGLPCPDGMEDQAAALPRIARRLLDELAALPEGASDPAAIGRLMAQGGWLWGGAVLAALGLDPAAGPRQGDVEALKIWRRLPHWQAEGPPPPPGQKPVSPADAVDRLIALRGADAEQRPGQVEYAAAVADAFTPRRVPDGPNMVLAEAGTGVGKTLGYLAPSSLWAEKNGAPVWISTFTRNLQHQIDMETARLHPNPEHRRRKVVIRKGRENYLCLLNLEEAAAAAPTSGAAAMIAIGLMARWAAATRDGDLGGGDLPGWLPDLVGRARTVGLADRRGECIYSACLHYSRCFVERTARRARKADIVIANHALVMSQAALGGDEGTLPARYVLDEGHHLFEAADGAFATELSGREAAELRRWLIGQEGARRGGRGVRRRIGDLLSGDEAATEALDALERAARLLPGEGWRQRLLSADQDAMAGPAPSPFERLLAAIRSQTYARAANRDHGFALETEARPVMETVAQCVPPARAAVARLRAPLAILAGDLRNRLSAEAEDLDSATRQRIETGLRGIERRRQGLLAAWDGMLAALVAEGDPDFVDWFDVGRDRTGRDLDIAFRRHWLDPTRPLAEALYKNCQGVVVTSATLTDMATPDGTVDWQAARRRCGFAHQPPDPVEVRTESPFDYGSVARLIVVGDVDRDDPDQLAGAYRALFTAAGGGALGLFTAIHRLRAVRRRLAGDLSDAGLTLLSQHEDGMDVSTLIDIFRGEPNACLLGTDAVRDGVDVPGPALRLIVFDRVPWPRPSVLHRSRAEHFGKSHYVDMLTRLRLRQAFGRLIRREGDIGVFVILDRRTPTRLFGTFPPSLRPERIGLAEASAACREFLSSAS